MLLRPIYPFQTVDRYLFDAYHSGSPSNAEQLQDPQLDAMIDQARTLLDPTQSQAAFLDVQRYLAERLYTVGGLPVGYGATLLQPWVQNYVSVPEGYSAGRAWRTAQLASS